ncbi:DUF1543 domain-containing protein [Erwinia psidii]|uniref:DUF1543 domain-containing protein n=1 Tax=Erwinia psidii TaxID=69224 RepID=A0A3N6TVX0_9GAMM|nr:DUF1543 domain-containing protein [Erwinia psidii]MCX8957996.1 DUF1543 domain-containing protein [Erwinia psidii]MCX8962606.1 DUF1543 domain-containing protein [Erwinia psidii]MCX8963929.1 DUF1543 domain-containing protein [Erwinia psidii]RQM39422.1 DUF1543 domain-containing protein [Erwinia psidii]
MHLYIFYLGGNAGKSNIEVHDIQFVAARKPEDAWPALREAWFGDADKLHIDGYARLTWADGFNISLCDVAPDHTDRRLWFVNAGAYHPSSLAELHAFDFFVAKDAKEAKARGLASLLNGAQQQHKDNLKEVDDCLLLEKVGGLYVHLTPCENGTPFTPEWQGYQPIGR